jgi:hypothetical protein
MNKYHKYACYAVAFLLVVLALIAGACVAEEDSNLARAEKVSKRSKLECEFLGRVGDTAKTYVPVYFCKHKERNACFYVIADYDALAMTAAPCIVEGN